MKKVVNNRICAHCEKRFVGCTCARTLANDGSVVHKTCRDEYEVHIKNKRNAEEHKKYEAWKKENNKK